MWFRFPEIVTFPSENFDRLGAGAQLIWANVYAYDGKYLCAKGVFAFARVNDCSRPYLKMNMKRTSRAKKVATLSIVLSMTNSW